MKSLDCRMFMALGHMKDILIGVTVMICLRDHGISYLI